METLLNDPQYYVDEHFAPLIRNIDLHFEKRQPRNDEKRLKLIKEIVNMKLNIVKPIGLFKIQFTALHSWERER